METTFTYARAANGQFVKLGTAGATTSAVRCYRDASGRFVSRKQYDAELMGDLLTYSAPASPAASAKVAKRRAGYVNNKGNRGLAVAV